MPAPTYYPPRLWTQLAEAIRTRGVLACGSCAAVVVLRGERDTWAAALIEGDVAAMHVDRRLDDASAETLIKAGTWTTVEWVDLPAAARRQIEAAARCSVLMPSPPHLGAMVEA